MFKVIINGELYTVKIRSQAAKFDYINPANVTRIKGLAFIGISTLESSTETIVMKPINEFIGPKVKIGTGIMDISTETHYFSS